MKYDNILNIYKNKLKYFNYSENTIKIYLHYCSHFLIYQSIYPQHLTSKNFQDYLDNFEFKSISQQNQIISSIKFLYENILNKKYDKINFKRPRKEKILPKIIDGDYLLNQISKINNIKHKSIISLAYSTGMRVSEVINLKIQNIDSKRMLIYIKNSKGKKDRIVPLSNNLLLLLRKYFKEYKPKEYLFNGQNNLKYSTTSCNRLVKKYLGNKYHFHLLRHSCFTKLLENGTDLRIIQKIAGHSSIKTTEIYTHVSNKLLKTIKLPI